ncbi:MAG: serine protease [Tannerella sp.]|jgi:hypothetical protein|nr:serine protease [Tannerella sp.]
MTLDDKFNSISTRIITSFQGKISHGTGFFFQETQDRDPNVKEGQWSQIRNLWLITNKHVLLSRDNEGDYQVPDSFTFHYRKINGSAIEWFPVTLNKDEIKKRAKIHINKTVDIAAIEILDLQTEVIKKHQIVKNSVITEENLPGKNKIDIEVSNETIILGYPKGFYDQLNLFPIVKSGIIASRWGAHFNGHPYFLIDAKLFPGSSGSLVISRPINQVLYQGKILTSQEKLFVFLGVYSGEPFRQSQPIDFDDMTIIRKEGFNLGIVWYSYLVVEIIKEGKNVGE